MEKKNGSQRRKTILLTGATGVVGRALLQQLDSASVICLIHEMSGDMSGRRTISGDVSQPHLGLRASDHRRLSRQIDCIVHAAAITDFSRPEEEIRRTNVDGTRHMVELAAEASVPLYFISTAFAADGCYASTADKRNAYEQSKRDAEDIVKRSGVPHVIVRPSIIVGDSKTGSMTRFQGLHFFFGLLLTGFLPILPAPPDCYCDFVPQDLVAESIRGLIEHDVVGEDCWLTSGEQALSLRCLVTQCVESLQRLTGRSVALPRMCGPDVVERLIRPVFLPSLTVVQRKKIELALEYTRYINIEHAFLSSLSHLNTTLGIPPLPNPVVTLEANLCYWADTRAV